MLIRSLASRTVYSVVWRNVQPVHQLMIIDQYRRSCERSARCISRSYNGHDRAEVHNERNGMCGVSCVRAALFDDVEGGDDDDEWQTSNDVDCIAHRRV